MILEIPVRSDPQAYQFLITLEGTTYGLRFIYNARTAKWYMSVKDEEFNDIVNGLPIYTGYPIVDRFRDTRLPPGTFLAYDTEGANRDPGQDDFGTRVRLIYFESEG